MYKPDLTTRLLIEFVILLQNLKNGISVILTIRSMYVPVLPLAQWGRVFPFVHMKNEAKFCLDGVWGNCRES